MPFLLFWSDKIYVEVDSLLLHGVLFAGKSNGDGLRWEVLAPVSVLACRILSKAGHGGIPPARSFRAVVC